MPVFSIESLPQSPRSRQWRSVDFSKLWRGSRLPARIAIGIVAGAIAASASAGANSVQVTPVNPKLGDTASVVVHLDNPAASASPTIIDRDEGETPIFVHLSRINVKGGGFVQPGQVMGAAYCELTVNG